MKTERTQIHFLSDVLVAVASLDLKVPNEQQTTSKGETWSRATNSRLPFAVNAMLNLSIVGWARILPAGQQVTE